MSTNGPGMDTNGKQENTGTDSVQPPTELVLMRVLNETLTATDWKEIIAATIQKAKEGDGRARAWLASYVLGKPKNPVKKLAELESDHEFRQSKAGRELSRLFADPSLPPKIDP